MSAHLLRTQTVGADHPEGRAVKLPMLTKFFFRIKFELLISDFRVLFAFFVAGYLNTTRLSAARIPIELSTVLFAPLCTRSRAWHLLIALIFRLALLFVGFMVDPALVLTLTLCASFIISRVSHIDRSTDMPLIG